MQSSILKDIILDAPNSAFTKIGQFL